MPGEDKKTASSWIRAAHWVLCWESNSPARFGWQGTPFRSQVLAKKQERLFVFMVVWDQKLHDDNTWVKLRKRTLMLKVLWHFRWAVDFRVVNGKDREKNVFKLSTICSSEKQEK